jgi:hypothetical protein
MELSDDADSMVIVRPLQHDSKDRDLDLDCALTCSADENVGGSPGYPCRAWVALQSTIDGAKAREVEVTMAASEAGMEARIARLESDVGHIRADMSDVKTDVRMLRDKMDTMNATLSERISGVKDSVASVKDSIAEVKDAIAAAKIWALLLYIALAGALFSTLASGFGWL